jgi:dolichyl-phosphate-mannose--protein O-mannosyl transferase
MTVAAKDADDAEAVQQGRHASGRTAAWASGPLLGWASRNAGWLGPLLVAVFAGVVRFVSLGHPHDFVFDETYYPKDAWSLLKQGYEGTWPDSANKQLLANPQHIPLGSAAEFIAHPPLGKWVIAIGEGIFGLSPFGWRFMTALLGTACVLMTCRIGRRLFGSTLLGCTAGLLLACDGLSLVLSRVALLDGVLTFWVLAAFGCLLIDRDKARERLAAGLTRGWRPWRIAAGVALGCACATKWNGAYFVAGFGLLTVLWDAGARRKHGDRRPYLSTLLRDAGPAFGCLVLLPVVLYVASWTGWFASSGGWDRHWAAGGGIVPTVRGWWHYQAQMWDFNTTLSTPHTYQSNPWSWLVMARPVSMYWHTVGRGHGGCTASGGCTQDVLALGTPLLWWIGCAALVYAIWRWAFRRDWRFGAVLCAVAFGWLPWLNYQDRTVFSFYMVVIAPYLCLAVAGMLGAVLGPVWATAQRRRTGAIVAGLLVVAIIGCFAYFYPIYTAEQIPMSAWRARMWWTSWI